MKLKTHVLIANLLMSTCYIANAQQAVQIVIPLSIQLSYDAANGTGIVQPSSPTTVTVAPGSSLQLVTNPDISARWTKDGAELATTQTGNLIIGNLSSSDSGHYRAVSTAALGLIRQGVGTEEVIIQVAPNSRIANISSRAYVQGDDHKVIVGFIVNGTTNENKKILVRVIGSSLIKFGVTNALIDPAAIIYDKNGTRIDIWKNYKELVPLITDATPTQSIIDTASHAVGAFSVIPTEQNYITYGAIKPGAYTLQAYSINGHSGEVLVEVYEVP